MTRRALAALLVMAPSGLAANLPRFAFTTAGIYATGIAVDPRGNTYLTGSVQSNGFSATPGAFQTQSAGGTCYGGGGIGSPSMIPCHNSFVIKLDSSGANEYCRGDPVHTLGTAAK